jgi:hypothetical protein
VYIEQVTSPLWVSKFHYLHSRNVVNIRFSNRCGKHLIQCLGWTLLYCSLIKHGRINVLPALTNESRAGDSVVECLPSMCKALSSIPSIEK